MHWAARAVRTARPRTRRPGRRLRVEALEAREVPTVTGTVYIDQNLDGFIDPEDVGVAGVTVTATASTGATETATTGDDGTYTLQTGADNLRVAFSNLPTNARPGRVTDTSGPLVRFLDANSDRTAVDLALAAPQLVTTQFFYDDAVNGANAGEGAVIAVPYGADSSATPTVLANVADVGSVWGLAYQPSSNTLFASSFLKRHAGLGPNADGTKTTTGGIYQIDPTGAGAPQLLIDLNAAGAGLGTGADPHPKDADPDGDWFHDSATLPLVGKRGLGGLAISQDGKTLYTVNLATRELVEIPLNPDGTRDTSRSIRHTPIPLGNSTDLGIPAADFNSADVRPFAVAVRNGAVFVGVTYTAETSGLAADLRAYVLAFDPNQGAFRSYNQADGKFANSGANPVLTVNLTYPRGLADDPTPNQPHSGDEVSANWKPWVSTFPTNVGQDGFPVHPSPWLTDIAFDGPNLVLGLRDRFGDQGGFQTGNTAAGSEDEFSVIAAGDILRAAPSGTGWQLESNGTAGGVTAAGAGDGRGPGGGEFYQDAASDPVPQEVAMGALAQVPGFGTIAATGNDPDSTFSGGIYTFANANTGVSAVAKTAGTVTNRAALFESFDLSTFGDANGLGDLAALPADGTVQVGDRVFADANGNGIQDAGEPGLANVTVDLFQGTTQVDTTATDDAGNYQFDNLRPNATYQIKIDTTQTALAGRTLTAANKGPDDLVDSDATPSGTTATVVLTTGEAGTSDHSLDVGFTGSGTAAQKLTLGDRVFRDANNNGRLDAGETGVAEVTVDLLDAAGLTVLATATTDGTGTYRFAGLDAGTYRVRLAAVNFSGSGPLVGFTSSTASASNPDDNVDGDANGITAGTLGSGGTVQSGQVTLTVGGEPTTDGDADPNTNMTVDFGVVPPAAAPTLTLGDTVFKDTNNNGTQDAGEPGIPGVAVELLDQAGSNVLHATTTSASGTYSFSGLVAGGYRVRLAAANFNTGGALAGFTPSTTAVADPSTNVDKDSNGTASGTLGQGGFVVSGPVALAAGTGPTNDGDNDPNTNLSVDFGLVPPAPAGNTLSLGGTVWNDADNNGLLGTGEAGIAGASVQLLDSTGTVVQTTATGTDGTYTFGNLAAGSYKVRLPATDFTGTGPLVRFTSSTGTKGSPAGPFEGPATPSPNNGVANDKGQVTGTLGTAGGFVETGTAALAAGAAPITTVDFGLFQPVVASATGSLSGQVFLDFNNNGGVNGPDSGISGVTLTLSGGTLASPITVPTDSVGNFAFDNLAAGTYTLTETQPTSPANVSGKVIAGDSGGTANAATNAIAGITLAAGKAATGYTFAEVPIVSTGGAVYEDTNANGIKDAGEPGIPGVAITLTGTSVVDGAITPKTATTGADGTYTFTNLTPGTYTIAETQPTGFANGKNSNGTPPAATVANDKFAGIDLTSAVTSGAFNFGEVKGASLAGFVYADANDDGSKAATGEPGIAGVKLRLVGSDDLGHPVDLPTTTGADGSYLFGSLRPGTYKLVETQPAGYVDGKETTGTPAGNTATNDQITGIQLASGTTATGFLFGEQARAGLRLTQSPATAVLNPGGTVTITFTLKNTGTATATAAAAAVNFGGLSFVSASDPTAFDSTTKTWTVGDLAAGDTKTIRLTLRANGAGTFAPSAHATTTAAELSAAHHNSVSTISVGAPPPTAITPARARGFLRKLTWFLSSSTNAWR